VQDRDDEVFPVIALVNVPDFNDGWFGFGQINSFRAWDISSGSSSPWVFSGLKVVDDY
jgi:hypothetical protein